MILKRSMGAAAFVAAMTMSTGAFAQGDIQAQIDALKEQIANLEKNSAVLDGGGPAPQIRTPNKQFSMNMRGRLLVDFGWASGNNGAYDVDAAKLRGAWLGIQGKATSNVSYMFEADFGSNKVSMKDAKVSWGKGVKVTIGHFKHTNSMELLTSGTQTTFMERSSLVNGFGMGRGIGASIGTSGDVWSFGAGVFRGGAGTATNDEGLTITARATYGLKMEGDTTMMFGGSFRSRDAGDGSLSYSARPGHNLTSASMGAKASGSAKDTMFGAEMGVQFGSFHVATEYAWLTAQDADAGADAKFKASYAEFGWFVTGEKKPLNLKSGSWGRPRVKENFLEGGPGAWQVVGKIDFIDLNDGGIQGGQMTTYMVGVNWYLNRYTRFVANYNKSNVKATGVDRDINAFGLRFQVDW